MCKNIIDLDGEFNMMYSFRVKNVSTSMYSGVSRGS